MQYIQRSAGGKCWNLGRRGLKLNRNHFEGKGFACDSFKILGGGLIPPALHIRHELCTNTWYGDMFYQKIVRTLLENCTAGSVKNAKNTSNLNTGMYWKLVENYLWKLTKLLFKQEKLRTWDWPAEYSMAKSIYCLQIIWWCYLTKKCCYLCTLNKLA